MSSDLKSQSITEGQSQQLNMPQHDSNQHHQTVTVVSSIPSSMAPHQVIAAGKPFQGNQLTPHMLTTQGKQMLQGQTATFPGYTTIPAIPTTQNQTFVFSPLGVLNSQPNILPAHSQAAPGITQQQKPGDMHKAGGQMQFAPWQISGAIPQVWTGGLQAGPLPAGGLLAPNPIFIRGTQPEAPPSMFIQHSPQNVQHTNASVSAPTPTTSKPRASSEGMAKTSRPLSNILPSGGIRPASSVSTQTNTNQSQNSSNKRSKPGVRSPAPATKQDAANQTNKMQHQIQHTKQQVLVMNSNGQITSVEKQTLNKNMQQQNIMQQHSLQVSSIPPPVSSLVSQMNSSQSGQGSLPQMPTIQQQSQTIVGSSIVQTTVGGLHQSSTVSNTQMPSLDMFDSNKNFIDHQYGGVNIGSNKQSSVYHRPSRVTDKGLPKAMVKPNILTHVIEGYVIQEAAEPFAVRDVFEFIRKIPGCACYADEFLMQEVDGEALLLIKPEHLVMALCMKLGPALKIVSCIDALRPDSEDRADLNSVDMNHSFDGYYISNNSSSA
ncbi:unnamed protein product [Leptidea sinapis]|uniref:SAM domain-containing protein n=1 Tax=Leptidea sinapis TaxID=189913 RepID=A0A5E4PKJ3_9NEOP|nr:unnamed protein product [Leptidea sinapis]